MSGKPAATQCSHPIYSDYQEEYGEDPARVLYHHEPRHRIRGLKTVEIVRAYLDVETDRENPRNEIVAALNERLRYLQGLDRALDDFENEGAASVAADGGIPQ